MVQHTEHDNDAWSSRAKLAFGVFAVIAAFFLLAEHRAHVLPFLPLLFLGACLLMHLFMHGGHGGDGGHRGQGDKPLDAGSGGTDVVPEGPRTRDGAPKDADHQHRGRS